jgi:predicted deacylase
MVCVPPAAMRAEARAYRRLHPSWRASFVAALLGSAAVVVAQDFPPEIQPPPPSPPPAVAKPRPAKPVVAPSPEPEPEPEPLAIPPWPVESVGPPVLVPAGDPGSALFIGPPLVPPFKILDTEVLPGAKAKLEWNASQSFAGGEVISPISVVHGTRPGPVLCLTAAVHGDELNGVEIVRRVVNGVDPGALGGTVIGVPIVNLFGFSRNSRYLPDRRDLNRFFPGSRYGSIASRIAYSFFTNVVKHCDALVDFHTGSFDRSNLPQVRADLTMPEVLEFTRGFGATTVLHSDGSKGMLRVAAIQAGIPAVTFEVGGPGALQPEEIAHGVQAIQTLLHKLGMTRDRPTWVEPQPFFYDSVWVRSNAGGLLLSDVELGQRVQKGQKLGSVIDPINNIEREITSPVFGRVIGMALNQVVLPGFAAYHLGEETSEQQAVREAASGGEASPVEEDPDVDRDREIDPDAMPPEDDDEFEED